jgi:hypothetical protein
VIDPKIIINEVKSILNASTILNYVKSFPVGLDNLFDVIKSDKMPFVAIEDGGESFEYTGGGIMNRLIKLQLFCGVRIWNKNQDTLIGNDTKKGVTNLTTDVVNILNGNPRLNNLCDYFRLNSITPYEFDFGNSLFSRVRQIDIDFIKKENWFIQDVNGSGLGDAVEFEGEL